MFRMTLQKGYQEVNVFIQLGHYKKVRGGSDRLEALGQGTLQQSLRAIVSWGYRVCVRRKVGLTVLTLLSL